MQSRTSRAFELRPSRYRNISFRGVLASAHERRRNAMTTFKILGAAAILSSALGGSAMAQEATQEPAALGQSHPFVDYLTGGYGVRGTSRGQYGSYDGDYGPIGFGYAIVPVPGPYAYYRGGCVRGWYRGRDGFRHFC
jgi:hypothetical protein